MYHTLFPRLKLFALALLCLLFVLESGLAQSNGNIEGLEQAAAFINSNKLTEAEQQLNQILKLDPNNANALNLLGTIRARQENLTAAEGLFLRAIRSNADLAGAHLNLAHLYMLRSQPDKTAAELTLVLRLEPSNAEAAYRLASLMLAQRRVEECITFIKRTKQAQTLSFPLLALLGDAYLRKRDYLNAEKIYLEALRLSNDNVNALLGLAQISYARAELQSAADYMSRARAAIGKSPDLLYTFALVAMTLNLKAEALSALKTAVGIKPAEPSYRFALGTAWLKSPANLDEAEESFREFLKLRPDDIQGQLHLGYVLLKEKKLMESREWIQKTVHSQAAPEALYYLGLIAQAEDEDGRAVEFFLESLKKARTFASVHVALGATYLKLKDFDRAQQVLETAVKLSPDDSKAHYNLALVYFRLNRKDRAQSEMTVVQRLNAERLKREGKAPENDDDIRPPTSP